MITIRENYPLKDLNTFRLEVKARYFTEVTSENDLNELFDEVRLEEGKFLILGKGAKILFSKDYPGLVVKISIKGKKVIRETEDSVWLEVGAGEDWAALVEYTVNSGWGGLENLALIPGTVGAAPVQNLEAYGQSFSNVLDSLVAFDTQNGQTVAMSNADCQFKYRDSVFAHSEGKHLVVLKIVLKLEKHPQLRTDYYSRYESVSNELSKFATEPYTIKDIYTAVVSIRQNKLPDVAQIGSAGSFFKNPIVGEEKLKELQEIVPDLKFHAAGAGDSTDGSRVAAGLLLEEIGWKGKRVGNCGTWDKQALILVNYGGATSKEILKLAETIKNDFFKHYQIPLEEDVIMI